MYLHLGQNIVVKSAEILGIFDLDNTTVSKHTREFLAKAQQEGRVVTVSYELPKSFIVCASGQQEVVYLSQLSAATLYKRIQTLPNEEK